MIFGVWISQNPFVVRVSRNSLHTPACSLKIACFVVVWKKKSGQAWAVFLLRKPYAEQMFLLVSMRPRNHVDTQPVKAEHFKRWKGRAAYRGNAASAREWDFTAQTVWWHCAAAHHGGNIERGAPSLAFCYFSHHQHFAYFPNEEWWLEPAAFSGTSVQSLNCHWSNQNSQHKNFICVLLDCKHRPITLTYETSKLPYFPRSLFQVSANSGSRSKFGSQDLPH